VVHHDVEHKIIQDHRNRAHPLCAPSPAARWHPESRSLNQPPFSNSNRLSDTCRMIELLG